MPIPTLSSSHKRKGSLHINAASDAVSSQYEHETGQDDTTTEIPLISQQHKAVNIKRRSLLPQPGQTTASSRTVDSSTMTKTGQEHPPARLRPRSMYQNNTSHPDQNKADGVTRSRMVAPSSSADRAIAATTTGLGRSKSLRKPSAATQPAPSSGLAAHSRTKSSSNVPVHRREISSQPAPATGLRTSNLATGTTAIATRTSARLAGLSRTTSVKTKNDSSQNAPDIRGISQTETTSDIQPRRREIPKAAAPSRPAFTTLQQHFTPRKTGKAPTSTFLQPTTTPSQDALPPEIINLQAELLQLHLLHSSHAEVERLWQTSARGSLMKSFLEVASLYQTMLKCESTGQEQKNIQALLKWSSGKQSNLVEYIQLLSGPLHELPPLAESGGRLQRLVATFEQWMSWTDEIRRARSAGRGNGKIQSIESPDEAWKAEVASILRKMVSYEHDLDHLEQPLSGSSIDSILATCKTLVHGIREELQTMQLIVADVEGEEKRWVEDHLKTIANDNSIFALESSGEKAAWQI